MVCTALLPNISLLGRLAVADISHSAVQSTSRTDKFFSAACRYIQDSRRVMVRGGMCPLTGEESAGTCMAESRDEGSEVSSASEGPMKLR